ncbi:type I polyketide synthase [Actinomadura rupiterrae]|uniref:type I polyketide synthase n=1 Tax=Actinomadura rupiterrae TaxID=559627 RepID=UPI0020A5A1B3|nr:type I polyketide synthase [Actinomadura rupiterrae]MCP2335772.1 acyl transferase domain-containing protein/NAD(P)H-dependent flavin oxidoreductase YrpB (nitropropane dioxygenase family) [Actinomadura rupiterrae]
MAAEVGPGGVAGGVPGGRSRRPGVEVVGVGPFGRPAPHLAAAVCRAGGLGVLDLGTDRAAALAALADLARWWRGGFGVRVPAGCGVRPDELPDQARTVLLDAASLEETAGYARGRRLLAEVVDAAEAYEALDAGADGLIARGCEAGGRVGELTTFVLLQLLLADAAIGVPVLAAGGIGPHTAAAAVAGGAAGVVLDVQLALVRECELPRDVADALRAMDGGETRVTGGHRIYTRPDLPDFELDGLTPAEANTRLGASGLHMKALPVGQDGFLAAALGDRYRTAGGVVQAVRDEVDAHLRAALAARPLAPRDNPPGAPISRDYPVVQGPMTRVSDRSSFAAAIAQDGGLPFLALALMGGDEVRDLLTDTADRLGDRPWGVGVLGFAPPEVREAQIAAVLAARPPYALIAGGRPSQAAPLEEAGISTYLHVPSPGLLDRFLAEGARKFVFEGLECGGHVGPRASFPLWEAQVQRLLDFTDKTPDAADGMSVLFAGGIHDERSAAMVAALAGPLAERGADVRVLMGTAYLFTYEAVAAGAILPGFQQAAVECAGTTLLETSPGHATRCARTPYVEAFEQARRELEAAGTTRRRMWEQLEELNLGRLRIAAKGLRRGPGGGALQSVEPADQAREGMYMIGQVAALRTATTSITGLHEQVTTGALRFLEARAEALGLTAAEPAPEAAAEADPMDIAIVGIGCVFPEAGDAAEYWANIVRGVDAISEVPAGRWDPSVYFDPNSTGGEKTPSKWGGFVPDVPFDAFAYGIPPNSLSSVEPMQLLALEVAARALRDAGYDERPFDRSRTSVFFGAEAGTELGTAYSTRAILPKYYGEVPPGVDGQLPKLTEDSVPGVLTNVIAGRIANRFDLGGANYTVDAACAASLAALDAACKELAAGTSDMVLCGGADLHNSIYDFLLFSSVHALSRKGRCATFDAGADGIALGEGVACVVLKRLADAERDGDRIYAVVKSVAGSSDGRSLGLTAPRAEGQRRALDRAYARAGVDPARVGLIEAHGTGTEVGDRTELATLTETFTAAGAAPGSVTLGSVKSQIGHTKCAAGLAGLIKTAYALHHGVLPGTLHLTEPNRAWDASSSPFAFGRTARPWAAAPGDRIAGLSGFGFGGSNFHAVLAGYDGAPEPVSGLACWPAELLLVRGADRNAARAEMDRLAALADAPGARLRDLARTAAEPGPDSVQVAIVASGIADLRRKLDAARSFRAGPGVFVAPGRPGRGKAREPGKVAFLYPGQGSQRPNMLADLFVAFPRLQRLLRLADGKYAPAMFPPAAFTPEDERAQREAITDTRIAQPALGIAGLAAHRLLTELGVRPDLAAGHSYGELVALAAAGVFGEDDLVGLSAARAEAILAAAGGHGDDPGAMAACAGTLEEVRAAVAGISELVVANHNGPRQVVVSGSTPALEQALKALSERGIAATRIPVAAAFHSPLVGGAAAALRAELSRCDLRSPAFPVWSNTTAAPYDSEPAGLRATLAGQVAAPVRFVEQIEAMYAAGARVFVEAGPGRVLTRLVGEILGDRPHTAVACDAPGEDGIERLLLALAELAVAGVPVDAAALFAGRDARVLSAADPPAVPGWIVNGHLVRTADGAYLANGLRPAERVSSPSGGTMAPATPDDPAAGSAPQQDPVHLAVLEYLRSSRELVAAQRDVVLGLLGARTAASALPAPPPPVPAPRSVLSGHVVPQSFANPQSPAGSQGPADSPSAPRAGTSTRPDVPAGPAVLGPDGIRAAVLSVIGARTGYPEPMLGADLDLEADLSIDSIKRTEIIGELAERVGLAAAGARLDEAIVEQLARIKTIGEIVAWIGDRLTEPKAARPSEPKGARSAEPKSTRSAEPKAARSEPKGDRRAEPGDIRSAAQVSAPEGPEADEQAVPPVRQIVRMRELAPLPTPDVVPGRFEGRTFVIVDDGCGIALELAALLEQQGARVRTPLDAGGPCDGLIHLAALRPGGGPVLPGAYAGIREALLTGPRWLVLGTGAGGAFGRGFDGGVGDPTPGAGLRGLARTLAREFPETLVRAVDVDTKDSPRAIALRLLAEMLAPGEPVVVGHDGDVRRGLSVVRAELPPVRSATPGLGPDGVVLLTGGARGITARIALELARTTGCRVELLGRTPEPAAEDPELADAPDRPALRRALVAQGGRTPAEIEARIRSVLASREIRANLAALREHAAAVRYHPVDVRDAQAVRAVVEDVYNRHGRLDGVVHGAGLLEDRLVRDKAPDSFDRVYRTKVDGASALAAAVRPDLRFFVVFGSVAGVYGNRGQADYAAANDACDTLARVWRTELRGRVLVADWGPWAGGGMVSLELAREYARRGVGLLDPDAAVAALMHEIAAGDDVQVVLSAPLTDPADTTAPLADRAETAACLADRAETAAPLTEQDGPARPFVDPAGTTVPLADSDRTAGVHADPVGTGEGVGDGEGSAGAGGGEPAGGAARGAGGAAGAAS